MPPNPAFTRLQKERKRQEKAAAKRQERDERRRRAARGERGAGPPIDYEARSADASGPLLAEPESKPKR